MNSCERVQSEITISKIPDSAHQKTMRKFEKMSRLKIWKRSEGGFKMSKLHYKSIFQILGRKP